MAYASNVKDHLLQHCFGVFIIYFGGPVVLELPHCQFQEVVKGGSNLTSTRYRLDDQRGAIHRQAPPSSRADLRIESCYSAIQQMTSVAHASLPMIRWDAHIM
ncbi:MAG: hypothetical protein CL912_33000 [Deltaproteobacteria bacterium]|nr:hypothetical protein [Deltaproteobacteria bacterium]